MNHSQVLTKLYADFSKGDFAAVLAACDDKVTFQVAGKSALAGKYTKADFATKFLAGLMEHSNGTFKLEVHDILTSDRHGVALVSDTLTQKGSAVQMRAAHVWRFENGKPVAWYYYPRDLYQYDSIFA